MTSELSPSPVEITAQSVREHWISRIEKQMAELEPGVNPYGFMPGVVRPLPVCRSLADMYSGLALMFRYERKVTKINALHRIRSVLGEIASTEPTLTVSRLGNSHASFTWSMCSNAEHYFAVAVDQIEAEFTTGRNREISVYHDDGGNPLFLRKKLDVSTALTLDDMEFEGIPVPPGTIVAMRPNDYYNDTNAVTGMFRSKDDEKPVSTFRTIRFDSDIDAILPLRLSAFAFPDPMDRALFAAQEIQINPKYGDVALNVARLNDRIDYDLPRFQKAAHTLLDACGITN